MNVAIKEKRLPLRGKVIHLAGFARWRDKNGSEFAPCGALIYTRTHPEGCASKAPEPSATELPRVTCPVCQEQAGALGKAYAQARRHKEILW